jgi:hypothetical protein
MPLSGFAGLERLGGPSVPPVDPLITPTYRERYRVLDDPCGLAIVSMLSSKTITALDTMPGYHNPVVLPVVVRRASLRGALNLLRA